MNLGKNNLLNWVNNFLETNYECVEMLADGVAYVQLLDAIHPGSINIFKLNLTSRYPGQHLRNVRLVQDALKKLRINQPFDFQKISRGKFQDNIKLIQWIYSYAMKNGQQNLQYYNAFQKRLQILSRQKKSHQEINQHLAVDYEYDQQEDEQEQEYNVREAEEYQQEMIIQKNKKYVQQKIQYCDQFLKSLENDLQAKMQFNWRLISTIEKIVDHRDQLGNLLKEVKQVCVEGEDSPIKTHIMGIIEQPIEQIK